MPVLKAPPKQIRNATIQVRVEEEVDYKLRKYAEFIDSTPAFVVTESLRMLFNRDAEFREWLAHHGDKPAAAPTEKHNVQEPVHSEHGIRTMFDDTPQRTAGK